jgi:hypothetical protein
VEILGADSMRERNLLITTKDANRRTCKRAVTSVAKNDPGV